MKKEKAFQSFASQTQKRLILGRDKGRFLEVIFLPFDSR